MYGKSVFSDTQAATPREGDLFKIISLHGQSFEIRYGYYEEIERGGDPMEIYPDFIKEPIYTEEGAPFVTLMQDPCACYRPKDEKADYDCGGCLYMERGDELIAVCRCEENKHPTSTDAKERERGSPTFSKEAQRNKDERGETT